MNRNVKMSERTSRTVCTKCRGHTGGLKSEWGLKLSCFCCLYHWYNIPHEAFWSCDCVVMVTVFMIWRIYSVKFLFHLLYFEFCDLLIWEHINNLEPYLRSELWNQTISVNKYNVFICKKKKEQEYVSNMPQGIILHFGETELLFVQYATRQHIYTPQPPRPPRLDSGLKIAHFKTGRVVQWQPSNCRKQCAWSEWKSARKGSFDYCHLHEVVYLLHRSLWAVCFNASINHRVSEKSTLAHNSSLSMLSTYRPETTS